MTKLNRTVPDTPFALAFERRTGYDRQVSLLERILDRIIR